MRPEPTARGRELEALHRYQAALAAVNELLRSAQEHFDDASAAIEFHIRNALAAEPTTVARADGAEVL